MFDTTATGQLHRLNVFESFGNTPKFIEKWNTILPDRAWSCATKVGFCAAGAWKAPSWARKSQEQRLQMITFLMHRFRLESAGRIK